MRPIFRTFRQVVLLSLTAGLPLSVFATDSRVFVQFASGKKDIVRAAANQAGAQWLYDFDDLQAMVVTLPESARAALAVTPGVLKIEDDPLRTLLGHPAQSTPPAPLTRPYWPAPAQSTPYGVAMVQALEAVAAGANGGGIKIGVIDSGVITDHEDLSSVAITGEPDFGVNDERTWYRDLDSHGTQIVGIIAAANNSLGVVGVSPGRVSIHMAKAFSLGSDAAYSSDLLAAARAAQAKGVRIISMSFGGAKGCSTEERGFADLYKKGVLLIAAAGDNGTTGVSYPAGYASVVSVAAIDSTKTVAYFSQRNKDVELAAPGVGVLSTVSYLETNTVVTGPNGSVVVVGKHVDHSAYRQLGGRLSYGCLAKTIDYTLTNEVLVDRSSDISLATQVNNVQLGGASACVIANNDPQNPDVVPYWDLGEGNSSTIPVIGVSYNAGLALRPHALARVKTTLTSTLKQPASGYDYGDGTAFAAPNVAGVAALVWSKYPKATNEQVRTALTSTTEDLGTKGRDPAYGYGLVRAKAALDSLAARFPGGGADTVAPVISNVAAAVTNALNGSFEITWTTDEPATSDITLNGIRIPNTQLVTAHKVTLQGKIGVGYTYTVFSSDNAGNPASAGPFTHKN